MRTDHTTQAPLKNFLVRWFSHRTLALIRWDLHFIAVRLINKFTAQRSRIAKQIRNRQPRFLNLGSGPRGLMDASWINVDGFKDRGVQLLLDLNRELPLPDNCFEGIFSEHVFEHFDLEQGVALLQECFRVLKPGGCLRLIVPDGERILKTYLENPAELIRRRGDGKAFAINAVNSYFRQRYEHQYIYDWPMLEHQLIETGFGPVSRVSFNQGIASREILLDDGKYEWESLYVEAVKPS